MLGLPEGDWLRVTPGAVTLHGPHDAVRFESGAQPQTLAPGASL